MSISTGAAGRRQDAWHRFMQQHEAAAAGQQALLKDILRRNAETGFGREHGFRHLKTVEAYQREVPIRDWVETSPYVDAVLAGQEDMLTAEAPYLFHRTSGTTGTPKMIPFTRRCLAAQERTLRHWVDRAVLDNPGLLKSGVLAFLNAGIDGHTERRVPYGSLSGNIYFQLPAEMRRAFCHPYVLYHIADAAARRYALLRFALAQPCSFAFTGNASVLLGMFDFADRHAETLIRDIHDGTLSADFAVADSVRAVALNTFRPDPRRARALDAARLRHGRLRPADYWPGLQALGCWIGGSMGHFAPALREWTGPGVALRDVGYMASEGIFTIPVGNETPDGMLALHSAVFEFVPEAEFGQPGARALLAHQLEPGESYQIVITTTGGLYRYAMHDVVRVTSLRSGSPVLRFLYKGAHGQNLQGEKLTVEQVTIAMAKLTAEFGLRLRHFQLAAELQRRRYVLQIEPERPIPADVLPQLLPRFERLLGAENDHYEWFRVEGQLAPPGLRVMRAGWFDALAEEALARLGRDAQFKPAVLVAQAEHPELAEIVLETGEAALA